MKRQLVVPYHLEYDAASEKKYYLHELGPKVQKLSEIYLPVWKEEKDKIKIGCENDKGTYRLSYFFVLLKFVTINGVVTMNDQELDFFNNYADRRLNKIIKTIKL